MIFVRKLFSLLSSHDRKFLFLLLLFSIFVSLMETVGVAAVMPFISVASDFSLIRTNDYFHFFYTLFGYESEIGFVLGFGAVLIGFYLLRSLVNLLYFYELSKFSKGRYHLLAYRLFENYIGRSYRDFTRESSSLLTKTIVSEAFYLTNVLSALLLMMSELFVVLFIYAMMLYMSWKVTLALSVLLLANALFLIRTVSPKIKRAGGHREKFQRIFYEILNATFGNFKMIKLKSDDDRVLQQFKKASAGFADASIVNETLVHVPRLFLEALGFMIVVLIVLYFVNQNQSDASSVMPLISLFVLGLYRLMPSANRILNAYNTILYNYRSLDMIHNDLIYEIEALGNECMAFERAIRLENVSFAYTEGKNILNDVSLTIKKGEKVAFMGESGSGKSTLVDLIMGLYRPNEGALYVDGKKLCDGNIKSWRQKIGYIPQNIYLFDGTVAQNVAFHTDQDDNKIKAVLKRADILDFLEDHHQGIHTEVGENGLRLSGGQKQRIAIARALYGDPEVLVLDEATSALDSDTEAKIMDEIYALSAHKTLIVIAHRLSTIERCGRIFQMENGRLTQIRT